MSDDLVIFVRCDSGEEKCVFARAGPIATGMEANYFSFTTASRFQRSWKVWSGIVGRLPKPVNPRWRNWPDVGLAGSPGALVEGLNDFEKRSGLREGQLRLVVITRQLDDASFPTSWMVKSSLYPVPES